MGISSVWWEACMPLQEALPMEGVEILDPMLGMKDP